MFFQAHNCRPVHLPVHSRARYPPVTLCARGRRALRGPLSIRKCFVYVLLLMVSSTGLVCTLMVFWKILLPFSFSHSMSPTSTRFRRWMPPVPSKTSQPLSLPLASPSFLPYQHIPNEDGHKYLDYRVYSPKARENGITAILPVTPHSLRGLEASLLSIVTPLPSTIHEIIIACHPDAILKTERAVRDARLSVATHCPITVLPWGQTDNPSLGVLHTLSSVFTSQVLVLDYTALRKIGDISRMALLEAAPSNIPVGPRGIIISPGNVSCIHSPDGIVSAAYLVPPFLSPTSLLIQSETGMRLDAPVWAALGNRIVSTSGLGFGGLVMGDSSDSRHWCMDVTGSQNNSASAFLHTFYRTLERAASGTSSAAPKVNILLPVREDLESFGPTACEMAHHGYILRILLFSWSQTKNSGHFALDVGCHLHFETISSHATTSAWTKELNAWLCAGYSAEPDVLIYASQTSTQALEIEASIDSFRLAGVTIVHLSVGDLPLCEWMSLLSISEWQNWHKPRIDLAVITNDRPRSLARLLASITAARYYGDTVPLKINLEQTADAETRRIVARFRWLSGVVHVQHRVISAGLLPAVVEAWYPHTNDSYGVLLEDDVELSPMYYAWIKLTVLRYRYGPPGTRAPSLFGISLYQPTNLELRVEGRVPFEPRILFADHDLPDSRTPYLSQVPCSWGAVYFPEHFREFHDYLALRLSEATHDISEVIVPDIRSNRWTRSWKKYFNELVYLRGYVMLYPNFDSSLATNHVEVGAHVKSNPNVLNSIKRQFDVPLMPLPSVSAHSTGLLDLPDGTLPAWDDLPVLDLWGIVTPHEVLFQRGRKRHELLSTCLSLEDIAQFSYDARELLCIRPLLDS